MNNIITYVGEFKDRTFEEMPFNEVDSLVLCQLSYLNFEGYVEGPDEYSTPVLLKDIYESGNIDSLFSAYWYKRENRDLITQVAQSKRYEGMMLNYYVQIFNEEDDTQFSAVTYILPDKSIFIAYRGTDATLIGWKEDMLLAYSKPLKSQELSTQYLNKVSHFVSGKLKIGGHSKGGNLAVYAAMFCHRDVRDRLSDIFDHDGPGFRPEIVRAGKFIEIQDRIHKYIPRFSIVGIILEDDIDYDVVECWSVGALQHNSYMWKSKDGRFIRSRGMTSKKKIQDASLNEWIYSLSEEEVGVFVDSLFDILTASDRKTLYDLLADPGGTMQSAFKTIIDMDKKTKDCILEIVVRLMDIYKGNALEDFLYRTRALKEEMKQWQLEASAHIPVKKNREKL